MSKFLLRVALAMVAVYAVGAVLFAFVHYSGNPPSVPTILGDYHAWLGSGLVSGEVERSRPPSPPPAPPTPTPPPAAPPAAVPDPDAGDPVEKELRRIEKELLPAITEKARILRASERGDGVDYDRTRAEAMAALSEARTYLNGILEKDPHHRQANGIWTTLQELYSAIKRL
jgi:hypothetical protein